MSMPLQLSDVIDQINSVMDDSEEFLHARMNLDGIKVMAEAGISFIEYHPDGDMKMLKDLFRVIKNVAQKSDDKINEFIGHIFMATSGRFNEIDKDWTKWYKKRKEAQNEGERMSNRAKWYRWFTWSFNMAGSGLHTRSLT